ncbi:DUF6036 family nucleotidyltransferase [Bradyrhizobium hereditatis]|uniref:DUF6036 family nucleotidyltransferase n=1 Tax=Bradyrhizobium hereditatis TaxID=2821405 RepID=UPI00289AE54F|nr:DUF6036 family nucleotidyltransferase [Bradyrhizobium hereditatis]
MWEIQQKELDPDDDPEASEEINALYDEGSLFRREHGFYIDGVDENTARLPEDRNKRAITRTVDVDGRKVLAVAPCPEDIIVSKLARLSEKDKEFVEGYHKARPFDRELVIERIKATKLEAELQERAINFVRGLADAPKPDAAPSKAFFLQSKTNASLADHVSRLGWSASYARSLTTAPAYRLEEAD